MSNEVKTGLETSVASLLTGEEGSQSVGTKIMERTQYEDPKPTFSTLPVVVLERILDYLLNAADVRDTSDDDSRHQWFNPDYRFSSAILRVSRDLNDIGSRIFERNHFVLVSTKDPGFLQTLTGPAASEGSLSRYRVWHRFAAIAPFKRYHMRVHISLTNCGLTTKLESIFFILPMDNLATFISSLRIPVVDTASSYKLLIELKNHSSGQSLTTKVQESLLKPFVKLLSIGQRCTIRGAIDDSVKIKYEKILQPSFHWIRSLAWELIDVLTYEKNVANGFANAGHMWPALTTYLGILRLLSSPFAKMVACTDESVHTQCLRIHSATITNICMIFHETQGPLPPVLPGILHEHLGQSIRSAPDHIFEMPYVSRTLAPVFKIQRGFALLSLGEVTEGLRLIRLAAQSDLPEHSYIHEIARKNEAWALNRASGLMSDDILLEEIRMDIAMGIFAMSEESKAPVEMPPSVVSSLDYERYVLKGLGCQGDLLEERVLQRDGWSVDLTHGTEVEKPFSTKAADATIRRLRQRLDQIRLCGEKPVSIVWGLRKDHESGEFAEYVYAGSELKPRPLTAEDMFGL